MKALRKQTKNNDLNRIVKTNTADSLLREVAEIEFERCILKENRNKLKI